MPKTVESSGMLALFTVGRPPVAKTEHQKTSETIGVLAIFTVADRPVDRGPKTSDSCCTLTIFVDRSGPVGGRRRRQMQLT